MKIAGGHIRIERPDAPVRLLVFHHACASAMSFLSLARRLPPECEPCLFELPGRGIRAAEPPAADFAAAVETLLPEAEPLIDRPTILFGHSLGGLLAHAVVEALPPAVQRRVARVVVSASLSPGTSAAAATHPAEPFVFRSRDELLGELTGRGGCPSDLLDDPEQCAAAVTLLGHDLHLADTFRGPVTGRADVPFELWHGRHDPYVPTGEVGEWAKSLRRQPVGRGFAGGHFYVLQPEAALAMRELVESVVAENVATAGSTEGAEAETGI